MGILSRARSICAPVAPVTTPPVVEAPVVEVVFVPPVEAPVQIDTSCLWNLHEGDCLVTLRGMADASVDSVVTDPPYDLTSVSRNGSARQNDPETPFGRTKLGGDRGFMGKSWDTESVAMYECVVGCPVVEAGDPVRFFPIFKYCAKASTADRNTGLEHLPQLSGGTATDREDGSAGLNNPRAGAGRTGGSRNPHPTVKPVSLMRWLCRLVTPPGGLVLDPFTGSGNTGIAAINEGFRFVGCEREPEYVTIARLRIASAKELR